MSRFNNSNDDRQEIDRATGSHRFPTTGMLTIHADRCMVSGPFYRLVHRKLEEGIEGMQRDCYYGLESAFPANFWAALTPDESHMAWGVALDLIARQAVPLRPSLHHVNNAVYLSLQ